MVGGVGGDFSQTPPVMVIGNQNTGCYLHCVHNSHLFDLPTDNFVGCSCQV